MSSCCAYSKCEPELRALADHVGGEAAIRIDDSKHVVFDIKDQQDAEVITAAFARFTDYPAGPDAVGSDA